MDFNVCFFTSNFFYLYDVPVDLCTYVRTYIYHLDFLTKRAVVYRYILPSEPNSRGLFLLYFVSANNKTR